MKDHLILNYGYSPNAKIFDEVKDSILNHRIMPSMRALMTAGPALERDHIAAYNCSFIAVDSLRAFDEAMYVLMNGTGVGFSVESKYLDELPIISESFNQTGTTIVVEDSKLGWAKALKELIALLSQGQIPQWDMSKVRPSGARLKTFGGRASGPGPLGALFTFTVDTFKNAAGRRLKPIEAHDLMCKVGEVVVVGGVRRSALISLSNLDDFEMAKAKSGSWWETQPQRSLANNSAVYNAKPNTAQFLREWRNLYESKSGERGIYNIDSVRKHVESFGRRDSSLVSGTNPCGEIILRSNEFCNLTEVVISAEDTREELMEKVRLATILGTWQSTLTNFKYIRKVWKDNCEEERLLGVSLTGIYGNKITSTAGKALEQLLTEMITEIRALGFDINEFGKYTFAVNGVPAELNNYNEQDLIIKLIEGYKNQSATALNKKEKIARSLAKRAATKTGTTLNNEEMNVLIDELFACKEPNYAPDGKVCLTTISLAQLFDILGKK
jgi:ribonucleoside-diphosphate reductase alpha chain